jgi:hypothetical protein
MFHRSPFRCRNCRRRFYYTDSPKEQLPRGVEEAEEA